MAIDFLKRNKHYDYLFRNKFSLIKFKSNGEPILDPLTPDDRKRISKEMTEFRAELNQKSDQEIYDLHALLKSQETEQQKLQPIDECEFYNTDEARADYSGYWLFDTITIQEGVALLLKRNPKIVYFERMKYYSGSKYPFVKRYFEYIEYCRRHFVPSLQHPNYHPHYKETQVTHVQIETLVFIKFIIALGLQEAIEPEWLTKIEEKNKRKLTIDGLEAENTLLQKQLTEVNLEVEGIRLTDIRNADCLSTKMQHVLLASMNLWVAHKTGKLKNSPKEDDVIALLTTKGFSRALAKSAATIIKPDGIPKGRPKKV